MTRTTFLIAVSAFTVVGTSTLVQGVQAELAATLHEMFNQIERGEQVTSVPDAELMADPRRTLDLLQVYERSEHAGSRHMAYTFVWRIGNATDDEMIRWVVTARLLTAYEDPSSLVRQRAAKHLLSFEGSDFSAATGERLCQLLAEPDVLPDLVRVVGAARITEALPILKAMLIDEAAFETGEQSGKWYGTVGWAARLARSRMGVAMDLKRVIELVEAEPDDVIRVTVLLRHLAYTRQPGAYRVLLTYVASDMRLPPVKDPGPGTLYAQYALDALTQTADGFPVAKKYVGGYTDVDIADALTWMRRH